MKPSIVLMAGTLSAFSTFVSAQGLDKNCGVLTSRYGSPGVNENPVMETNTTNIGNANFYDTVACECRLNLKQTIRQAASKAIAATNAGLWAAVPVTHDLTAQENKEAEAFTHWMIGRGSRPKMHGLSACTYSSG